MKALPSPFPLATRELRAYLEERAEQHQFRAAELLNLYDKFLKKHHHPDRHNKPAHYIKLAAKETMKAELCRMTLAGLAVDAMKPLPEDIQEAIMSGQWTDKDGNDVVDA